MNKVLWYSHSQCTKYYHIIGPSIEATAPGKAPAGSLDKVKPFAFWGGFLSNILSFDHFIIQYFFIHLFVKCFLIQLFDNYFLIQLFFNYFLIKLNFLSSFFSFNLSSTIYSILREERASLSRCAMSPMFASSLGQLSPVRTLFCVQWIDQQGFETFDPSLSWASRCQSRSIRP